MERKIHQLLSGAKRGFITLGLTIFLGNVYSQTYTLSYAGNSAQTIVLPTTGNYRIECWGADGGDVTAGPGGGGKGGYSVGEYNVTTAGTQFFVFVGGKGGTASGTGSPAGSGGWNGGGGGGSTGKSGGGGGGATDVRFGGNGAPNRIIVAGGGGGAAYYNFLAAGGNGGGAVGQNGDVISSGNVTTVGGGGAGANAGFPGLSSPTFITADGTATGGGGGGNSPGVGFGQPGVGGGSGGAGGSGGSGSTGGSGGGGGGFAGGAGGVQTTNVGAAGGGGSGYIGGVSNGTTVSMGQAGFVPNPDVNGNGRVHITRLCNIGVFPSTNPMCIGNTITLTTDALSGITWFSGSNATSISVSPSVTTTYSLTGTSTLVINSSTVNCNTSGFITVTVNPLPALSIVPFPTVSCSGRPTYLTGYGAMSANSYSWSNGMNGVQVTTVNPTANSVYTLTGMNSFSCSNTQTIQLTMNTSTLGVSQSTNTICKGQTANLTASGAVTYTWSNGLMYQTIPVSPSVTTVYSVSASDGNDCVISNTISLTVNNTPNVSISTNKTTICKGESITLTGAGANTYSWSTNVQAPSVTIMLPSDITYYYTVTGTDANGCSGMANFSITASRCVGVEENTANLADVKIYPNPGTGVFNVYVDQASEHLELTVFNELGMLVKTETMTSNESKLDLRNEKSGIYFVRVSDHNKVTRIIKLVKD